MWERARPRLALAEFFQRSRSVAQARSRRTCAAPQCPRSAKSPGSFCSARRWPRLSAASLGNTPWQAAGATHEQVTSSAVAHWPFSRICNSGRLAISQGVGRQGAALRHKRPAPNAAKRPQAFCAVRVPRRGAGQPQRRPLPPDTARSFNQHTRITDIKKPRLSADTRGFRFGTERRLLLLAQCRLCSRQTRDGHAGW